MKHTTSIIWQMNSPVSPSTYLHNGTLSRTMAVSKLLDELQTYIYMFYIVNSTVRKSLFPKNIHCSFNMKTPPPGL